MMKRNLLTLFSVVAAAALAASCIGTGTYMNNRTAIDNFNYYNFLAEHPDSVSSGGFFYGTSGEFIYNIGVDGSKNMTGGFSVSAKRDRSLAKRNEKCNEYCVYDSSDAMDTYFAVFYQNPVSSLNAGDGDDIIFLGNSMAKCNPVACQIANTGKVADMIINGAEGFEPFKDGDYLKVTFTGYMEKTRGASVTASLAEFKDGNLSLANKWIDVDLAGLGTVTSIDVYVETNRGGLPLYFCMDNFYAKIEESY